MARTFEDWMRLLKGEELLTPEQKRSQQFEEPAKSQGWVKDTFTQLLKTYPQVFLGETADALSLLHKGGSAVTKAMLPKGMEERAGVNRPPPEEYALLGENRDAVIQEHIERTLDQGGLFPEASAVTSSLGMQLLDPTDLVPAGAIGKAGGAVSKLFSKGTKAEKAIEGGSNVLEGMKHANVAASPEAMARSAGGTRFYRVKPDGSYEPIIGVDAVDSPVKPGEVKVRVSPDGSVTSEGSVTTKQQQDLINSGELKPGAIQDQGPLQTFELAEQADDAAFLAELGMHINDPTMKPVMESAIREGLPKARNLVVNKVDNPIKTSEGSQKALFGTPRTAPDYKPKTIEEGIQDALVEIPEANLTRLSRVFNTSKDNLIHVEDEAIPGLIQKATEEAQAASHLAEVVKQTKSPEAFDQLQEVLVRLTSRKARLIGGEDLSHIKEIRNLDESTIELLTKTQDPGQIISLLKVSENPKMRDYMFEYFINNILSSPYTHARNLGGNATFLLAEDVVMPVKLLLSKGKGNNYTKADVLAAYRGQFSGFKDGIGAFTEALARGVDKSEEALKFATRHSFANSPYRIFRLLDPVVTGPTRLLHATDAFFRTVGTKMKLYELASIEARKTGADFAELVANPSDELFRQAANHGRFMTFTDELSRFGRGALNLRDSGRTSKTKTGQAIGEALRYVTPFVRTLDRLVARGVEFMPWNMDKLLKKDADLGDLDKAARGILGFGIMTGVAMHVAEPSEDGLPRIIGHFPMDPVKSSMLYDQHVKPFSIRIGDMYVPFNQMEPLSTPLALVASAFDAIREGEDDSVVEDILQTAFKFSGSLMEKTMMQGWSDLFGALSRQHDAPHKAAGLATRIGSGLAVPYSGLAGFVARAQDPTLRQRPSAGEVLSDPKAFAKEILPGSNELARYDVFGESPVNLREGQPFGIAATSGTPLAMTQAKPDPVYIEMSRLGVRPAVPGRTIKVGKQDVELTPQEKQMYQILANRPAKAKLNEILNHPRWAKAKDESKKATLEAIIDKSRKRALTIIKAVRTIEMHPSLTKEQKEARLKQLDLSMAKTLGLSSLEDLDNVEDRRIFLTN